MTAISSGRLLFAGNFSGCIVRLLTGRIFDPPRKWDFSHRFSVYHTGRASKVEPKSSYKEISP